MTASFFSNLTDDLVLHIIIKLEDDPRHWSRLACVSTKFSFLIRKICWKNKCLQTIPSIVSDLIFSSLPDPDPDPPGGWPSLYKLSICCPGLLHAGILLENSDFGLERELGPHENYQQNICKPSIVPSSSHQDEEMVENSCTTNTNMDCSWSLYDDLYFDTVYDVSECNENDMMVDGYVVKVGSELCKRKEKCRSVGAHLATGVWNLSREQGNKLLASRFRGDCLYICDWPGCLHTEEKRNYNLFRGIFKNFKRSQVWRTIHDGNRSRIALDCAFCPCKETWDLHSAFCLRRVFGYHDDGDPVVRAYVCENGHVSGAWTERPMYS